MDEPAILVACPDLAAGEERELVAELGRVDFAVVHNEERDLHAIAALDAVETAKVAWDAVRIVIDTGAAAMGAVELIRWFRRRRGPTAPVDIVDPDGSIYRVPSDLGPDGLVQRLRTLSGDSAYSYDHELEVMVGRIVEDDPATRRPPPRSARAVGVAKHHWDFMTQRWQMSSAFDEPSLEDLRQHASDGGPADALALASRLLDDPELVDEGIAWLRRAHASDESRAVVELARHDLLKRYTGQRADMERAAASLQAELERRDNDPHSSVRLPLARTLALLGRREAALNILATVPEPPTADAQPSAANATQRSAWQLQRQAALERARLLSSADAPRAERAYRRCLATDDATVVGQAAVELSRLLTRMDRAEEADRLLDGWISASGAVAREIGKSLAAHADEAGALRAYLGAGDRDGEAALRRGILLEASGRRSEARASYHAARASLNMLVVEAAHNRLRALNATA
jgi:predicted negative regulator of RcsB-dependent stress response